MAAVPRARVLPRPARGPVRPVVRRRLRGRVVEPVRPRSRAAGGLIARVAALYGPDEHAPGARERLAAAHVDAGSQVLLDALAAALAVHDDIHNAVGLLMGAQQLDAEGARTALRSGAAHTGASLHATDLDVLARREA